MTPRLIRAAELAEKLGMSVDRFRDLRRDLEAEGMPAPLGGALGQRWHEAQVDDWLARRAGVTAGQSLAAAEADLIERARV